MDKWLMARKNLINGYVAYISIHRYINKIALGGTRFKEYTKQGDAILDAMMLSKVMTFKAKAAGIMAGGGKAVIAGKIPNKTKKKAVLKLFSYFLEEFNNWSKSINLGIFKTGADVGIYPEDVAYMGKFTKYVHGFGKTGNLGLATAKGIVTSIKYLAKNLLSKSLNECTIGVQGLGQCGLPIVQELLQEGAVVKVNDIDQNKIKKAIKMGAEFTTEPWNEEIFCPSALGGILNIELSRKCQTKIICGSANNQLANEEAGRILHKRKIFWAPDYIVNIGGLTLVYYEDLKKEFDEIERYINKRVVYNLKKLLKEWPKRDPKVVAKKLFEREYIIRKTSFIPIR